MSKKASVIGHPKDYDYKHPLQEIDEVDEMMEGIEPKNAHKYKKTVERNFKINMFKGQKVGSILSKTDFDSGEYFKEKDLQINPSLKKSSSELEHNSIAPFTKK